MLPPGHWRLKLKICRLYHANMCKFDAEIKSYKDGKTICIYHNHYLPCTYNSKRCCCVCNCYYYDSADKLDMRTLLDGKNISSRTNGQMAARQVAGLIIKRLWLDGPRRRLIVGGHTIRHVQLQCVDNFKHTLSIVVNIAL